MKNITLKIALATILLAGASLTKASDIGVSVVLETEVAPGVYGRVELGNNSRPDLVYSEPRVIVVEEKYRRYKPVYLHVPPGHAKHWDKHCNKYNACNRKVYFVKSAEYSSDYKHDDHDHEKSKGNKGHGKGNSNGKGKNH